MILTPSADKFRRGACFVSAVQKIRQDFASSLLIYRKDCDIMILCDRTIVFKTETEMGK